jgi:eukaryotic-like serine/threonine-protein kinase
MTFSPGIHLGPYEIQSPLGAGGMGEVYRAKDTSLARDVAIKILPAKVATDTDRLQRFEREAKAIAALNHPNIVTIYGIHNEVGNRFIAMELVEGESLDRVIAPGGMPLAKIFDIAIPLADALAAAHDKGIVHRDLKPGNVMITRDGRVKVLDFGLAKLMTEAAGGSSQAPTVSAPLTGLGAIIGTVPYMSPEQLRGEAVDHRTDLFSLGIMLYEMASGQRPFKGSKSADVMSSILRDTPRPLHELNSSLPRPLEKVVSLCLEKDPDNRLQSAKDVRNELRMLRKEVDSGILDSALPEALGKPAAQSSSPPQGSAATLGSALSAPTRRGEFWIGIAALIAIVVVVGWWLGRGRPGSEKTPSLTGSAAVTSAVPAEPEEVNSLAVLPFTNLSSDKEQEYFSDGLTEELLNALVKIPELKVVGRTSSFSFKGKNENLRTIGEKLGVANILEGSVRKSGDKVRITAQLVKAADGFHLWSETYDRTLDDIFAVQDDIAQSVAAALKVTLLGKGAEAPQANAEAYDLVLQARFVMQARTEETNSRARKLLERALQLSPDYAPAWAEMGLMHFRESERATTVEARQQAVERARSALARALELDSNLAVAHSRMAGVQRNSWDFAGAERSTARAVAADPKNPIVMGNAAIIYDILDRRDEAIVLSERALKADPLNVNWFLNLANYYNVARRFDEAEALCRKALELAPDNGFAYLILGDTHLLRGETEAARKFFANATELLNEGDYGRLQYEALVEHTAGNAAASLAAATEFEKRFGAQDPAVAAQIRAWRGDADAAFAWLDKALAARDPGLPELMATGNYMKPLHSDPRWNELLKKIGLPTD